MNGTFEKTLIIAPDTEPIYYPFQDYKLIKLKNVVDGVNIIEKYMNKINILIDSRLKNLVLICFLNYGDETLIYNVHNNNITVASEYINSSAMFNLNNNIIHTVNGEKLIYLYLFCNYVVDFNLQWSINKAINSLNKNNIVELILNYIGVHEIIKTDSENQNEYINEIENIVKNKFKKPINKSIKNINSLYTLLLILIDRNSLIKVFI